MKIRTIFLHTGSIQTTSCAKMARASIVGIVAEVKRNRENDHICRQCCVYGISQEEFDVIKEMGIETRPRQFEPAAERYVLHCSPWLAMRALGRFGYCYPGKARGGMVEGPSGQRRICIWTMVNERNDIPRRT